MSSPQESAPPDPIRLTAYQSSEPDIPIVPASCQRDWMTPHTYHCLPLTHANQAGWFLLMPYDLTVVWDGEKPKEGLEISYPDGVRPEHPIAASHFGHGIITFRIPYLFRTSPGYNLVIKGPSNYIRTNAQALEGIMETDWAPYTFTMNWKLHTPGIPAHFRTGEPICMIHPQRRDDLEATLPELHHLEEDQDLKREYESFHQKRKFNRAHNTFRKLEASRKNTRARQAYDHDYFLGRTVESNQTFEDHQLRLKVKPFADLRKPRDPD